MIIKTIEKFRTGQFARHNGLPSIISVNRHLTLDFDIPTGNGGLLSFQHFRDSKIKFFIYTYYFIIGDSRKVTIMIYLEKMNLKAMWYW